MHTIASLAARQVAGRKRLQFHFMQSRYALPNDNYNLYIALG